MAFAAARDLVPMRSTWSASLSVQRCPIPIDVPGHTDPCLPLHKSPSKFRPVSQAERQFSDQILWEKPMATTRRLTSFCNNHPTRL